MSSIAEPARFNAQLNSKKRPFDGNRPAKRRKLQKPKPVKSGSNEDVLLADVQKLLAAQKLTDSSQIEETAVENKLPEPFTEIEIEINELSSTGDGLGLRNESPHIYVVPFTAPGDVVKAKGRRI